MSNFESVTRLFWKGEIFYVFQFLFFFLQNVFEFLQSVFRHATWSENSSLSPDTTFPLIFQFDLNFSDINIEN